MGTGVVKLISKQLLTEVEHLRAQSVKWDYLLTMVLYDERKIIQSHIFYQSLMFIARMKNVFASSSHMGVSGFTAIEINIFAAAIISFWSEQSSSIAAAAGRHPQVSSRARNSCCVAYF